MALNPKNVQQAVRLAIGLANPTLRDTDWFTIKERFHLDDYLLSGVKALIEKCAETPELKTVLNCLTHGS